MTGSQGIRSIEKYGTGIRIELLYGYDIYLSATEVGQLVKLLEQASMTNEPQYFGNN